MDVVPVEIVAPQTQMLDTQRESDLPSCNIEWALTGAEHDHESLARRHRATRGTAVAGVEVDTRCAQESRHHGAHEWRPRAAVMVHRATAHLTMYCKTRPQYACRPPARVSCLTKSPKQGRSVLH